MKEYVARGTYIYPPRPSMRLIVDTFAYCAKEMPNWNTISISGYHIREAGSTAVQEIAFTLANGIAYVEAALAAGLALDDFAPRLCFFFNAHNNLFEEVAKYRAARRLWATIMRERFGAKNPKSMMLRFHTQTGGSTLTAQQPENNIMRVTLQALAATLGGTQSLHTNGFDEALGLPTERAAQAGPSHPAGHRVRVGHRRHGRPAGGLVLRRVADRRGRAPGASSTSTPSTRWVARWRRSSRATCRTRSRAAAYDFARCVDRGDKVVVGVNRFRRERVDQGRRLPRRRRPAGGADRAGAWRSSRRRDNDAVRAALDDVASAARGTPNVLYPMKIALSRLATLGRGRRRPTRGVRGVPPALVAPRARGSA